MDDTMCINNDTEIYMEYFIKIGDMDVLVESQKRNVCEEIVDQLCNKRVELGLTQQDVADITGIKRPNIARIEGCTTTPTIDVLVKYAAAIGCRLKLTLEEDETQRIGRDKDTLVDSTYISSGEYRRKFDLLTDSPELNRLLYIKAKEMLLHRSGTELEDMYWFDMDSATVICSKLDESNTREIRHTKAIDKKLKLYENILAMHTHPHSMPPSAEDFNSYLKAGYKMGVVLCHDGTIYRYYAFREVSVSISLWYINKYLTSLHDDKLSQLRALDKLVDNGDILYEEVHL